MRLVLLADTHMFHDELAIPDGDVLVHAGDLCQGGELPELEGALDWLRRRPHGVKLLVAGNHDWPFQRDRDRAVALCGADIIYLEDSGTVIEGVRFWGSPWQPEFNDWAFNLPRGPALARRWALIPAAVDVLITHGPPAGIGDGSSVGERHGCEDLRRRVAEVRPRLHLFGHIHEDGGLWTQDGVVYANVTTCEGERAPTVIDLEQPSLEVRAVSVPPRR